MLVGASHIAYVALQGWGKERFAPLWAMRWRGLSALGHCPLDAAHMPDSVPATSRHLCSWALLSGLMDDRIEAQRGSVTY